MDITALLKEKSVQIIVKANSPKTEIAGWDSEKKALRVNVRAAPEKGKANAEIIKLFTRLTKKKVKIISGLASKRKALRLS